MLYVFIPSEIYRLQWYMFCSDMLKPLATFSLPYLKDELLSFPGFDSFCLRTSNGSGSGLVGIYCLWTQWILALNCWPFLIMCQELMVAVLLVPYWFDNYETVTIAYCCLLQWWRFHNCCPSTWWLCASKGIPFSLGTSQFNVFCCCWIK